MKTGRNDLCPCGSSKKFKKCCEMKMAAHNGVASGPAVSSASLLQEAVGHHQAGRLDKAETLYRLILEKNPKNPDALHLFGMVNLQRGDYDAAESMIRQAIRNDGKTAFFHLNLGNVLKEQGKRDDAIASFRKALSLKPDMAEAHYNLATELSVKGEFEAAVHHLKKALRCNPGLVEAYYNLGVTLGKMDRVQEAVESYGNVIKLNPYHYDSHYNVGLLYQKMGRYDKAVTHYRIALEGQPGNTDAHYFLGTALLELEQFDEAELSFRRAIMLRNDFADAYNDLSVTLRRMGRTREALEQVQHSLKIKPSFLSYNNLGIIYREDGSIQEAIEAAEKAISLKPDSPEAHWNLALALLHFGDFEEGWENYEWRVLKNNSDIRPFPFERWDGSPPGKKTLFILSEQGVGDQIMFASLFTDIAGDPEQRIVDCDRRLVPLFARSFPGFIVVPARQQLSEDGLPAIDVAIPMGSLPRHLRPDLKSFPRQKSYLVADTEKTEEWRRRFNAIGSGPKVGISWRGGKDPSVRHVRSTMLEQWNPLFSIPGVHFINLQYGDCAQEIGEAEEKLGAKIHDWEDADPLSDLDNFAAEVAALDLVISVDNATVHMAGALGIPTWVLLPKACDWRWMSDVEDSPWYASVRLFRQETHGVWKDVFHAVGEELKTLLKEATGPLLSSAGKSYRSLQDSTTPVRKPISDQSPQGLIDQPIFILGVPRSGTSMIAGLLDLCGAWTGNTVPGGPSNPRGFFEHIILREKVNKELLSALKCDPLGVASLPDLDQLPRIPNLSDIIKQVIKSEGYGEDRPWLFKGAKLTLIWPLYKAAFPSARWIIIRRKSDDVIRSCLKTHFMVQHSTDPLFWSRWVEEYLQRLEKLKQSGVWWREIWPHDVVSGDLDVFRQLVDDLGLAWDEHAVKEFILPEAWHAPSGHKPQPSIDVSEMSVKDNGATATIEESMNDSTMSGRGTISETSPEPLQRDLHYSGKMSLPLSAGQSLIDQPIFILGVPRSGTSMVAGLLHLCGAWTGKTVPGAPVNPRGFFEHIILREGVNKKILSALRCDPLGVKRLPELDSLPAVTDLSVTVKQVIQSEGYTDDRPWLFKDAKLTLIWPIYKSAFPLARWIIVRRKNDDIIRSCLKTNFMVQHSTDPQFWSRWIDEYLQRLDRLKQSGVWWREIWPHDFVFSGDFGVLHQLINDLGLAWDEHGVQQFILPTSWHASEKKAG